MDIDLQSRSLAMWVVCEALKDDVHLIDSFDNSRNGVHDIRLTVDGVELNFLNVINRIDAIHSDMVREEAGKMYLERFDRRSDEITDELERIANQLRETTRRTEMGKDDLKTIMFGSDTVIVTENANGDPYIIQAKYLQDILDDWQGECDFVPANDARVFFAMYNGNPINPYCYSDFESLLRHLCPGSWMDTRGG